MATVQSQMLELALRVDPMDVSGALFTSGTVGVNDGRQFPKQRLLDLYNQARYMLLEVLREVFESPDQYAEQVAGNVIKNATFAFSGGSANKPSSYVDTISLTTNAGLLIPVLQTTQLERIKDSLSVTNPAVFEYSATFVDPSGGTNVPNGSNYILYYIGMTPWVMADVTTGTAVEAFIETHHPRLIDIAAALCHEQGDTEVMALITQMLSLGKSLKKGYRNG